MCVSSNVQFLHMPEMHLELYLLVSKFLSQYEKVSFVHYLDVRW